MNDFEIFIPGEGAASRQTLYLATVGAWDPSAGTTLIFDGQQEATTKRFKRLVNGTTPAAGDRVLVARISGSYVILGKIGF